MATAGRPLSLAPTDETKERGKKKGRRKGGRKEGGKGRKGGREEKGREIASVGCTHGKGILIVLGFGRPHAWVGHVAARLAAREGGQGRKASRACAQHTCMHVRMCVCARACIPSPLSLPFLSFPSLPFPSLSFPFLSSLPSFPSPYLDSHQHAKAVF